MAQRQDTFYPSPNQQKKATQTYCFPAPGPAMAAAWAGSFLAHTEQEFL